MSGNATAEFKLSITRALASQLSETLIQLTPAPLTTSALERVEARPGVYELFLEGERVYVGKASSSLQERLQRHRSKLSGRLHIDLRRVEFVCVYVDEDLDAAAPEKLLIKKYRAQGGVPWNTNGFGNKDPGRQRDTSLVRASHFDATYPIDLGVEINLGLSHWRVSSLLEAVKERLPFNFRFERSAQAKRVLQTTSVEVPNASSPLENLVPIIVGQLPNGWQATALPGYLILYRERREYGSALGWWRSSPDGAVEWEVGPERYEGDTSSPVSQLDLGYDEAAEGEEA
ncbi:GIY-YIG nuclease family protein [Spirillospora sp. CA-294931]|uniref:GIY-YIG nuclease family protein n=1 Tax=Spirillospora sp. CA-294931 TaxID=3240042 RepID=UPI003D8D50DE